jgi:phytoene/squalene synthetase
MNHIGSDLRMELTLSWLVGTTILDKIEDADYDVFTHRPQIRRRDKALIMARAAKGWASHMDLAALKALWPQ